MVAENRRRRGESGNAKFGVRAFLFPNSGSEHFFEQLHETKKGLANDNASLAPVRAMQPTFSKNHCSEKCSDPEFGRKSALTPNF
jgi:hypothetical protein